MKKAVLSFSGGLDSSTLLLRLLYYDYEVTCVSFDYGQKHKVELERAQDLVKFLEDKGVDSMKNVIDAHIFVFNDDMQHMLRLVHIENDCIIGFNYFTVLNNEIFGNAMIHKNEANLMRFLGWQGFNYAYNHLDKNKTYYVTLQGSENSGQNNFKKGFATFLEISKTHIE